MFEKIRPIDNLISLFVEANGAKTLELEEFFKKVGLLQFASMCLAIACSHPFDLLILVQQLLIRILVQIVIIINKLKIQKI